MINLNNYRRNIYHRFGLRECPHYGEDGVILKIFDVIGVNEKKLIIEFGENRSLGTTTRAFRIRYASKAVYFASGLTLKSKLLNVLDIFRAVAKSFDLRMFKFFLSMPFDFFVTPNNIIGLFSKLAVNSIDILSVDIDSYDYYVTEKILLEGYKPRLVILEYNPSLPLRSKLSIPFPPSIKFGEGNRRIYGASYGAINDLMSHYGYTLIHVSGFCNLFYIENKDANLFVVPNIELEATVDRESIESFIEKYCQKDFIPSWMIDPPLDQQDLLHFKNIRPIP